MKVRRMRLTDEKESKKARKVIEKRDTINREKEKRHKQK